MKDHISIPEATAKEGTAQGLPTLSQMDLGKFTASQIISTQMAMEMAHDIAEEADHMDI